MFDTWKQRWRDASTIRHLCEDAEALARMDGQTAAGSEHLVQACLGLADGSAQAVFKGLGVTAASYREAVHRQYADALALLGIGGADTARVAAPPAAAAPRLYQAAPSGQALMQRLAAAASARAGRPLCGADVMLAVAEERYSVAARAFAALGVEPRRLEQVARAVLQG